MDFSRLVRGDVRRTRWARCLKVARQEYGERLPMFRRALGLWHSHATMFGEFSLCRQFSY